MTMTTFIIVNLAISLLVIVALAALVVLAHRLPTAAPHADESWGRGGDPFVVSDPLPLAQVAAHETDRELDRAA